MSSTSFSESYSVSYWGSITVQLRLSFSESYTASTNKSVLTLTGIEFKKNGTAVVGTIPVLGTVTVDGTTVCTIDNSASGKRAEVYLTGEGWCSADLSNVTITPVTVTHNADGSKSVTVALSGGSLSRFCAQYAWYHQTGTDPGTGHAIYTTTYVPFGVSVPTTGTMALETHTRQWTVSYNSNGGTGAPGPQTKTCNIALTLSGTRPNKASASAGSYTVTYNYNGNGSSNTTAAAARSTVYTFSGWNTASDGSGTSYNPGGSYTANAAATLYAQWTGAAATAAVVLPSPTRSGYSLAGWYTAASGGTRVGSGGASYTPTGNVTLYAHWTALASTISSCSASVVTTNDLTLSVSRKSSSYYHKATFRIGSTTLATSSAFAASLSYTVPRSWFNSYPNDTSKTVTVSVQTYTDANCSATVGSAATTTFTMTADSGMKPSVVTGWVVHARYNTGTAAEDITEYVKGYSRSTITFDSSKITMANGATINSYSITCQGTTVSSSPYRTPVLTSTSVPVVCTVTDSRGRTASGTLTITVRDYAKPTLSGISVFRCNANGTADEDGTYYSVRATTNFSSLNGKNSCALTGKLKAAGCSFGSAYTLTSGTSAIKGTISADTSYTVRLTAADALGNTATYDAQIPTRKWAMKFRPTGNGVAFGKNAEYNNTFEICPEWDVKFGKPSQVKEAIGLNDAGMNFTISKLTSAGQLGTLNWTVKNTAATDYVDHRVGLLPQTDRIYMYDYTGQTSIWYIPADFITNAILNSATNYTSRTLAANAVWDSMEDGKHKIGRVQIKGTNYTYWAMRNSTNYAVVILTTYSGSTIYKYVKTNGTVSGYAFTGTADS